MKISKELAIKILEYLEKNTKFYFPFRIFCKEYSENGDLLELEPKDWKMLRKKEKYQTFKLQENLQDLREDTTELLAKGFLEKITGKSAERQIALLAKNYRKEWKEEIWESDDIEEFGLNEFIGGKAEGYEESLELIKQFRL